MMTTLQKKGECGKGPKKTFAPPAQKLQRLMPSSPNSLKENILGISFPEIGTKSSLPKAKLVKKNEKAPTENVQGRGQEKKRKNQYKKAEKKAEKEGVSLTNAEFEEIVQIVLQKSLQECLETSCAQPIACSQSDKEPGTSSVTTDNGNADGERLIVPHTPESSASQQNGVVLKINAAQPGQPDPAPPEKTLSRLSLNKRKKGGQNDKPENFQDRHENRQKDQSKKTGQDHSQIKDQQKEKGGFGQCLVWVQCSSPNCEKWRRLHGNIDPSVLPDNWSCDQNTDLEHNRCDIPEETWTGHENDVAYASYIPGSIIWAKQYGYPWWPGMVESDPDLGEYFLFASHLDSLPSKYHVTFFGETVSRAWIPVNMLKNFQELSLELAGVKKCKNKDCIQKLGIALTMAQEAAQISIQERVNLFGFSSRYNEFDSMGEGKDLMLSEPNSPDSCLEKEEMDSEMEEKKGKQDPTLPGPRLAKTQTKRPKPRGAGATGLIDGRDGTVPKKTKKSLGDEPTVPPVPRTAMKEGPENSDLHKPGPKKKFKAPQSRSLVSKLSTGREVRMMPEGLASPVQSGPDPTVEKERPGPQEPPQHESESVPAKEEVSSDLDLEQLLEDVGDAPELREESQQRDEEEGFPLVVFEE